MIGEIISDITLGSSCSSDAVVYGLLALLCSVVWGLCDGFGSWLGFAKALEIRKSFINTVHKSVARISMPLTDKFLQSLLSAKSHLRYKSHQHVRPATIL